MTMATEAKRKLLEGEDLIYQGRPDWRAWPGLTILGFALAPVVVGLVILLVLGIRKRSISWLMTTRRIETEIGWLTRRIDTLELWRVTDVQFRQGFWERMFGVASVVVVSHDETTPRLELCGLPGNREVFDQLANAVMVARQQRGVMNVTQ
jgi:membrane protein YdbS with pleckstrin-like domain